MIRISPPPTPSRRCTATVLHGAIRDWRNGGITREEHVAPCRAGAIAFVTEVDFCWGHVPAEWRLVAERRRQQWTLLAAELWDKICVDTPGPDDL